MTEAETQNLKMWAEWLDGIGDEQVMAVVDAGGVPRDGASSIRSALAEIDRLKAAHRETVNLIAWLDPARTRTAQYRQMAQDAGIPEDAP